MVWTVNVTVGRQLSMRGADQRKYHMPLHATRRHFTSLASWFLLLLSSSQASVVRWCELVSSPSDRVAAYVVIPPRRRAYCLLFKFGMRFFTYADQATGEKNRDISRRLRFNGFIMKWFFTWRPRICLFFLRHLYHEFILSPLFLSKSLKVIGLWQFLFFAWLCFFTSVSFKTMQNSLKKHQQPMKKSTL